jgi:hypothetical protein
MKRIFLAAALALAACGNEGSVADDVRPTPPDNMIQMRTGDWSTILPAVGRTPEDGGYLTKGPIVTDLHAMIGKDAIDYRKRLIEAGGPLTRDGDLLVTVSQPGPGAIYLIVDPRENALEAGWDVDGTWKTWHTAGTKVRRPASVSALRGD